MTPARTSFSSELVRFAAQHAAKVQAWQDVVARIREQELKAVVWGAGSKGVTFLNLLQVRDEIRYVVDLNPRKHGRFVAGTGQQIVPPEFLREYRPDLVILVNAAYTAEVRAMLESLHLRPELLPA